jgi:hypothetical protein
MSFFTNTTENISKTASYASNPTEVWVVASSDANAYYGSHKSCEEARKFILRGQVTNDNCFDQVLRGWCYFSEADTTVMTLDDLKAMVFKINDNFKKGIAEENTTEVMERFIRRENVSANFLAALNALEWKPERVAEEEAKGGAGKGAEKEAETGAKGGAGKGAETGAEEAKVETVSEI